MESIGDFQIDGIPVFVAPRSGEESITTIVSFRVGTHDEVLAHAGLTRLTHRLIAASLPFEISDYVQSSNDGLFTFFEFSAPEDLLPGCMAALAGAIRQPKWEQLDQLRRMLAADPVSTSLAEDMLLNYRYGAVGPGTDALEPLALTSADQDLVETWLRRYFGRDNCSITVLTDGALNWAFNLPSAERQQVLSCRTLPKELPAYSEGADEEIIFQLTVPPSAAGRLAMALLGDSIERRITRLESLAPRVRFDTRLIDSSTRAFTGVLPVPSDNLVPTLRAISETISDMADGGIGDQLFEQARERLLAQRPSPEGEALLRSLHQLFPAVQPAEDLNFELQQVTRSDVVAVIEASLSSWIFRAPAAGAETAGLKPLEYATDPPVEGDVHHPGGYSRVRSIGSQLICGAEGMTLRDKTSSVTIRFLDCAAVIDKGTSLNLVNRKGESIDIPLGAFRSGAEIATLARSHVPEDRIVRIQATSEELKEHKLLQENVRDFTGWRRIVSILVLLYFGAHVIRRIYQLDAFLSSSVWALVGVLAFIGLMLLPRPRAIAFAAVKAWWFTAPYLPGAVILVGTIDSLLLLGVWESLQHGILAVLAVPLLALASVPFVLGFRTAKRTEERGTARVATVCRSMCLGAAIQAAVLAPVCLAYASGLLH